MTYPEKAILLPDGKREPLEDWQRRKGLTPARLSPHFTVREFSCGNYLLIAEPLIELLETFRSMRAQPVRINSGYRTPEHQEALRRAGYRAALTSPHVSGMAADIDTTGTSDTTETVKLLQKAARKCGIPIRLGFMSYQSAGQTFVHVDICPWYYAPGRCLHHLPHPQVWEKGGMVW